MKDKDAVRRHTGGAQGDPPAWIETLGDGEAAATPDLGDFYARYVGRRMPHILRSNNLNPRVLKAHDALYRSIMFGQSPLTRVQREMIATVVSIINQCHY